MVEAGAKEVKEDVVLEALAKVGTGRESTFNVNTGIGYAPRTRHGCSCRHQPFGDLEQSSHEVGGHDGTGISERCDTIRSAARRAKAAMVLVGFTPLEVTN